MSYACPRSGDFDEVRALNAAFLAVLRSQAEPQRRLDGLERRLAQRLLNLEDRQVERLATVPMLLMSFCEDDEAVWEPQRVHEPVTDPDAFVPAESGCARLQAAGLGFVWQLARRDPYSLRLLTGVTLHWCECIADQPFLSVLKLASGHSELPVLRASRETRVWRKLLSDGVSQTRVVREAAHMSSLQMRLTLSGRTGTRWASAACRMGAPSFVLRGDAVK
ncbi:MAG: hypothetical protein AAF417_01660 [Pseudomonadota bacterium]